MPGFKSGYVAFIGKPNVGKSTLINRIVGQKVSIVSSKPQTTRRKVLGIATHRDYQIVFIDTPGIHEPHTSLGKAMVDSARSALSDADVVVVVVDGAHHPGAADAEIAKLVSVITPQTPVLLCLNKMDQLKPEYVESFLEAYTKMYRTDDYMLTTATKGHNVDRLVSMIVERLPEGTPLFGEDEFTDQSSRFLAAELVREKILLATRQEVPHAVAVQIQDWQQRESGPIHIAADIIVERPSQKAILIGKQGTFLKKIGTQAREDIEQMLDEKVYLELHVKVREDWRMNPRMLHELEYGE